MTTTHRAGDNSGVVIVSKLTHSPIDHVQFRRRTLAETLTSSFTMTPRSGGEDDGR